MPEKNFKNQIEAILFASGRLMDADMLVNLVGASSKQVIQNNITKLQQEYEERNSPMMIVGEKEGWKLTVREPYLPLVRRIVSDLELPKTILETLAVIAWQAPMLQSKVIEIRHNKAYDHIAELEELGFIAKEKEGRSYMLKLTNKFFNYFEVDDKRGIRELFKNVKQPEQKKVDEFEPDADEGSKDVNNEQAQDSSEVSPMDEESQHSEEDELAVDSSGELEIEIDAAPSEESTSEEGPAAEYIPEQGSDNHEENQIVQDAFDDDIEDEGSGEPSQDDQSQNL